MLLLGMSGLIVLFWFLNDGEVLRFLVSFYENDLLYGLIRARSQVLFIGVMSCLYVLWDVIGMASF